MELPLEGQEDADRTLHLGALRLLPVALLEERRRKLDLVERPDDEPVELLGRL